MRLSVRLSGASVALVMAERFPANPNVSPRRASRRGTHTGPRPALGGGHFCRRRRARKPWRGPREGMKYDLFVKAEGRWRRVRVIQAASHAEALRRAIARLRPEHYDKPIRLQQAEEAPPTPTAQSGPPDGGRKGVTGVP